MNVIARRTLVAFWTRHQRAEGPFRAWYEAVTRAVWSGPAAVKRDFGANVDFVADNRAIFDTGGNKFRLIVHISYRYRSCLIKFVGTHAEYDKIDPSTIEVR